MTVIHTEPATSPRTIQSPSDARLKPIVERVLAGERLDHEDGVLLFETPDIHTLCGLADLVRRRMHGNIAWFNV